MNIKRGRFIAGASMVAAASSTALAQQTPTAVRVASSAVTDAVPLLYAQNNGLFRNAGLDVTFTKTAGGSVVVTALTGGAVDIGKVSSVSIILAHVRGIGMQIVVPDRMHTFGPQSDTQLIVAADGPIKSGRDLNGKTISVAALKDSTWIGARLWIDSNGGDSSTVKFIELPFSAVAAAVLAGRIDCGVDNDPYLTADVRSGKVRALGDLLAGLGSRFLETAWVSMADYNAKNRDTVNRFVKVMREAQAWANAHPTEVVDLAVGLTGVDRAAIAATRVVFSTEATPKDMQPYVAACAKYGVIPQSFDAAELYFR